MADLKSQLQRVKAELKKASNPPSPPPSPAVAKRTEPQQSGQARQEEVGGGRADGAAPRSSSVESSSLPEVHLLRKGASTQTPTGLHRHPQPLVKKPATSGRHGHQTTPQRPSPAAKHAFKPAPKPAPKPIAKPLAHATPKPVPKPVPKPAATEKRHEPNLTPRPPAVDRTFRPLPKGTPTRKSLFRSPEAWVADGGRTQFGSPPRRGTVDIVIGLDFGTSYTKAAVGFMDKIFPVTWGGVSKCSPDYLLPSEYTQFDDGLIFLGQHTQATSKDLRGDLKLPFINPAVSTASIAAASLFLALVLRYIRAWVYHHHGAKLGRSSIRWQLNLGAPSNGLEHSRVEQAYRALAATAWRRSLCVDPCRLVDGELDVWRADQPLADLIDHQIRPEFVAQMAGYMQSPQRQRGLHALIDVGGGTLDVVTFNVHKVDDEDTFPFLVPQIHPLGTHGLVQNRLAGLPTGSTAGGVDELAPIEGPQIFAASIGVSQSHVEGRDALFSREVGKVVSAVFEVTKSKRYRLSDAWKFGVRTFFTGGGSQLSLYEQAVRTARVPSAQGLHLMPLPLHPKLDGFSGGPLEYQRVSVACGLAQDAFTLGRVVPAKEVEDDRPVTLTRRASRPDRDELYPK